VDVRADFSVYWITLKGLKSQALLSTLNFSPYLQNLADHSRFPIRLKRGIDRIVRHKKSLLILESVFAQDRISPSIVCQHYVSVFEIFFG